jgi:hypothetical protein
MALSTDPVDPAIPAEALIVVPERESPVPSVISSIAPVPAVPRPNSLLVAMIVLPELVPIIVYV